MYSNWHLLTQGIISTPVHTKGQRKSVGNTDLYHISIQPPCPSTPSTHEYILLKSTNHSVQRNACSYNNVILFACDRPTFHGTRICLVACTFRCMCVGASCAYVCACICVCVCMYMFIHSWY